MAASSRRPPAARSSSSARSSASSAAQSPKRRRVPCRFFNTPNGCIKKDCTFEHSRTEERRRAAVGKDAPREAPPDLAELYYAAPGVPRSFVWVNSDFVLEDAWERHWQHADVVALDTEFRRRKTYRPEPALVQISSGEHTWLIDSGDASTRIRNWQPLLNLFQSGRCVKVIHACREDISVLFALLGDGAGHIRKLFDTQLVASTLADQQALITAAAEQGDEWVPGGQAGYARLVKLLLPEQHQQQPISKEMQKSDWTKRPLSPAQLEYAAQDVRFLIDVYRRLCKLLSENEYEQWHQDVHPTIASFIREIRFPDLEPAFCKNLPTLSSMSSNAPDNIEDLIRQAWELWNRRERVAQLRNLPRQWILKDDDLFRHVFQGGDLPRFFASPPKAMPSPPPLTASSMAKCLARRTAVQRGKQASQE